MEVITFDSEAFREIMQRLNEVYDLLQERKLETRCSESQGDGWIGTQDLSDALNLSSRTLQRMRTNGELPYTRIKHRCCYRISCVVELLDNKVFNCDREQIERFKRQYISVTCLKPANN